MADNLTILFVEDLITDYELALYEIKKVNPKVVSHRVDTQDDYLQALQNFKPDIIISDYIMPQFNGMSALMLKKQIASDTPFIMLTGSTNEETAVQCMKAGADDYVIKEHIKRLPLSIKSALDNSKVRREVKQTQQELARRELLLRNAVNNLPSTFTIYDSDGRIEYMNDYGLTISGLKSKDAVGKKENEVFGPDITENYIQALNKTIKTKEAQVTECMINYAHASRYVIYHFVPTLDENNNIYKVLGIAYDITERREAEEKLKIAIKRAEEYDLLKSAFLANISHEIRTPLNAIMGFAQMIRKSYTDDEQLGSYIDIIMLSSNQLLEIIREMIEISQLVSGKSNSNNSTFYISDLLKELDNNMRILEEAKIKQGIAFELDLKNLKQHHDKITTDREKLIQIIKNLISNAFKFTYQGLVTFGCMKSEKGLWHFYVSDTGIGIEDNKLDVIFDIFRRGDETFTRQVGGVGLGLTICKELVSLLGGEIWVESSPGKGSVFHFILPEKRD
ncbi:MAG TPA: ATP-binding protein [Bacteroidales bacterium]|jgi:PAS domain S-box-containing protein|nr:ATP-binding protein [Bacteroidales bacterium]